MLARKTSKVWSVIVIFTVIACITVLVLHYKNWLGIEDTHLQVRAGFYHESVPFVELDSVYFVDRIPPMERLHGFSALQQEKGVFRAFKDSLTTKKVYVFVDNINQQKLKLVYRDSMIMYLNQKDSLTSVDLLKDLQLKIVINSTSDSK